MLLLFFSLEESSEDSEINEHKLGGPSGPLLFRGPAPFLPPLALPWPLRRIVWGQLGGHFQKSRETLGLQGGRSERVGFEPTVRLPVEQFFNYSEARYRPPRPRVATGSPPSASMEARGGFRPLTPVIGG